MRRLVAGLAVAALAAGVARAEDPTSKDSIEIKLAAKVGDVFRFRETDSSSREVNGRADAGAENVHEYSVTVKAARADGGLDVDLVFESIRNKRLNRATGGWSEIDTSKSFLAGADMKLQIVDTVTRAMVGRAVRVTLDPHGVPTASSGMREAIRAGIKGAPMEAMLPVDEVFSDADCMKLLVKLFAAAPAGPRAVGSKWTGDAKADVNDQGLDFAVESTLTEPTADDATVASKYAWKPGNAASDGGAKGSGGGESTTKFSRKDGFVLSMTRRLEANREAAAAKATSHTDWTIERLPPAEKKPADAAKPADAPPAKPEKK